MMNLPCLNLLIFSSNEKMYMYRLTVLMEQKVVFEMIRR